LGYSGGVGGYRRIWPGPGICAGREIREEIFMGVSINRSKLKYEYSKTVTNGDSPKFRGKPDSVLFNRQEEYEVVPMIEAVFTEINLDFISVLDLERMEDLIQNELPGNIRKREEVFDWLVDHF